MIERFMEKVCPEPNSGCHLWIAGCNQYGYGLFRMNGKHQPAHRVAWFLEHGRWPAPGLDLCHTCDVRSCVNPAHLWEGTRRQNIQDASSKGRLKRSPETLAKMSAAQRARGKK